MVCSFLLRPSIPGVTSLWERCFDLLTYHIFFKYLTKIFTNLIRAKSEGGVSKTLAPFLAHTLVVSQLGSNEMISMIITIIILLITSASTVSYQYFIMYVFMYS